MLSGFLIQGLVFVAFVAVVILGVRKYMRQRKALAAWASQNGWRSVVDQGSGLMGYLPSYLENNQGTPSFDIAFSGAPSGVPMTFFRYNLTVEEQDGARTNRYLVFASEVNQSWPKLLLLHHSALAILSQLGEHSGLERLSLEGDFNDQFDCYISPNSQIQALSLLSPDTMNLIEQEFSKVSLQVDGRSIVISLENGSIDPLAIQSMVDKLVKLVAEINTKPLSEATN